MRAAPCDQRGTTQAQSCSRAWDLCWVSFFFFGRERSTRNSEKKTHTFFCLSSTPIRFPSSKQQVCRHGCAALCAAGGSDHGAPADHHHWERFGPRQPAWALAAADAAADIGPADRASKRGGDVAVGRHPPGRLRRADQSVTSYTVKCVSSSVSGWSCASTGSGVETATVPASASPLQASIPNLVGGAQYVCYALAGSVCSAPSSQVTVASSPPTAPQTVVATSPSAD